MGVHFAGHAAAACAVVRACGGACGWACRDMTCEIPRGGRPRSDLAVAHMCAPRNALSRPRNTNRRAAQPLVRGVSHLRKTFASFIRHHTPAPDASYGGSHTKRVSALWLLSRSPPCTFPPAGSQRHVRPGTCAQKDVLADVRVHGATSRRGLLGARTRVHPGRAHRARECGLRTMGWVYK